MKWKDYVGARMVKYIVGCDSKQAIAIYKAVIAQRRLVLWSIGTLFSMTSFVIIFLSRVFSGDVGTPLTLWVGDISIMSSVFTITMTLYSLVKLIYAESRIPFPFWSAGVSLRFRDYKNSFGSWPDKLGVSNTTMKLVAKAKQADSDPSQKTSLRVMWLAASKCMPVSSYEKLFAAATGEITLSNGYEKQLPEL